jgi:hypothetical protein
VVALVRVPAIVDFVGVVDDMNSGADISVEVNVAQTAALMDLGMVVDALGMLVDPVAVLGEAEVVDRTD